MSDETKEYVDDRHAREVCKIGQRAETCRYLTMSPGGWSCEKLSSLKATLDMKASMETMSARSDNCPGRRSR